MTILGVIGINRPFSHSAPLLLLLAAVCALALFPAAGARAAPPDAVERAAAHLSDNAAALGLRPDLSDLRLAGRRTSLTAEHVRYQQTVHGVPVFGATVSVSLPNDDTIEPVVRNRYASGTPAAAAITRSSGDAYAAAAASLGVSPEDRSRGFPAPAAQPELVYMPSPDKTLRPAWQLITRTSRPLGTWLHLVDAATGRVLHEANLLRFDDGRVFDPNPVQTNGGVAPAPHCDTPQNEALMAGEYAVMPLLGINAGQDKLKGPYVDLTAPGIKDSYKPAGVADEPARSYIYPCNDDRFEEVMAYHHLDRTQRKFQQLGFTGLTAILDRPVPVHAHFMSGCNAFFDPLNRGLHFGDFDPGDDFFGCGPSAPLYDGAEDADVIIHEYGHAVQDDQVPGWGFSFDSEQTGAIGEGFSDFLAGVMNNDPCIGDYINFEEFACGGARGLRWLQNDLRHPQDLFACGFEPHCAGQIWSGVLWDLVEELGGGVPTQQSRDLVLTLVLESHFYLDQAATFDEGAAAVCLADKVLYSGAHVAPIAATFAGRGITTGACAATDFPSFYVRILHPFSGDLDLNIKVGADVNAPVCTFDILDPDPLAWFPHLIGFGFFDQCGQHLPPTVGQPWWLEVQDVGALDAGTVEDFQILLAGGTRCWSSDTPLAIPDQGPPVYAKIDCTTKVEAPPTPTATPIPGLTSFGNIDCTSGINSVDGLKVLRYSAGLSVDQAPGCVPIGGVLPNGELQADVNCSNSVNSVDGLFLLRYASGLPVAQDEPCPDIGSG